MDELKEKIATVIIIAVLVVAILALGVWMFQVIWNWVAVDVFHAPHITYWQAFGITALLSFVGGFFKGNYTKRND